MKSSLAISHLHLQLVSGVSVTSTQYSSHQALMMEAETVSETFGTSSTLTWMIAREDFIECKISLCHFLQPLSLPVS
jgi:hypothetical protein